MGFPSAKVHRLNRRKMGRGQAVQAAPVTAALSSTGTTNVTITFSRPVVVRGTINNTVATKTLVSQTIVSGTVVTQVWSGNVTGLAYSLPANPANVSSQQGGSVQGVSGSFA